MIFSISRLFWKYSLNLNGREEGGGLCSPTKKSQALQESQYPESFLMHVSQAPGVIGDLSPNKYICVSPRAAWLHRWMK